MLLAEYDEKLHLESEKKISYEEGEKNGEEKERQRNRKLLEALRKIGRENEFLTAFDHPKRMKALYREFGIN